jgi:hypothetical protein
VSLRWAGEARYVTGVVLRLSRASPGTVDGLKQHVHGARHVDEHLAQIFKLLLTLGVGLDGGLRRVIVLHAIARSLYLRGNEQFFERFVRHMRSTPFC